MPGEDRLRARKVPRPGPGDSNLRLRGINCSSNATFGAGHLRWWNGKGNLIDCVWGGYGRMRGREGGIMDAGKEGLGGCGKSHQEDLLQKRREEKRRAEWSRALRAGNSRGGRILDRGRQETRRWTDSKLGCGWLVVGRDTIARVVNEAGPVKQGIIRIRIREIIDVSREGLSFCEGKGRKGMDKVVEQASGRTSSNKGIRGRTSRRKEGSRSGFEGEYPPSWPRPGWDGMDGAVGRAVGRDTGAYTYKKRGSKDEIPSLRESTVGSSSGR
ncbi:hypothetical protein B0H19DRAFT_1082021 [Mycena capillaripes]|nr:hypothetical protein B0H19DRAFT_1082021 [Mycena capillaripes]